MSSLDLTLDGARRLAQTSGAAADELRDLTDPSQEVGDLVIAGAVIPVRSGRMRKTVRAIAGPDGVDLVAGGPDAPYTPIVHARNPFLTRALTDRESVIVDRYADHVQRVVDTIEGA